VARLQVSRDGNDAAASESQEKDQGKHIRSSGRASVHTGRDTAFDRGLACTGGFVPAVRYPYLALLASGGHTSLVIAHGLGHYAVIGGTLDDAIGKNDICLDDTKNAFRWDHHLCFLNEGEAFDKTSRLLNISQGNRTSSWISLNTYI
jgi:hypothetical protein